MINLTLTVVSQDAIQEGQTLLIEMSDQSILEFKINKKLNKTELFQLKARTKDWLIQQVFEINH